MSQQNIEAGDYVKHKTLHHLSGGTRLLVADINEEENEALVGYFDEKLVHKEEWFPLSDLTFYDNSEKPLFFS